MKKILLATALLLSPVSVAHAEFSSSCSRYLPTLIKYSPGWDAYTMSRLMYRESRCNPTAVSTTDDYGLLQLNKANLSFLSKVMGEKVTKAKLLNPTFNIRAAAKLYRYWEKAVGNGYQPWGIIYKRSN